jgi:hypothetical protein
MQKTKIMGIGIGRAGNVILNEFLKKDRRYSGLFVNSAYGDVDGLEKFDINKNAFLFPATSGTGRDRNLAKEMLKDHVQSLADTVARYPLQDVVTIFFSLDGGTGSGIVPVFTKVLKRTCPSKKINLVGVIPDFNRADKIALENTLACWSEIAEIAETKITVKGNDGTEVKVDVLDDIKFIDNSKRKTFELVNRKAIEDLDYSFTMNGKCEFGSIDDNDAKRTTTAKGYGLILNLDGKYRDIKNAIDNALEDTVFAKPNSFACNFLAVSLKDFDVLEAVEQFEVNETAYMANNEKHNTIVLGGCDEPTEIIETIKIAYDDFLEKGKNKSKIRRTTFDIKNKETEKEDRDLKTNFTTDEFDTLFDDLFER